MRASCTLCRIPKVGKRGVTFAVAVSSIRCPRDYLGQGGSVVCGHHVPSTKCRCGSTPGDEGPVLRRGHSGYGATVSDDGALPAQPTSCHRWRYPSRRQWYRVFDRNGTHLLSATLLHLRRGTTAASLRNHNGTFLPKLCRSAPQRHHCGAYPMSQKEEKAGKEHKEARCVCGYYLHVCHLFTIICMDAKKEVSASLRCAL